MSKCYTVLVLPNGCKIWPDGRCYCVDCRQARQEREQGMQFTAEEIKKACDIAEVEVLKRHDRFKPAHATAVKDSHGWICEKIYLGSAENELTFSLKIQWNYPLGGAVGRIMALVHARLVCLTNERGRFLRLQELHMPVWQKLEEKLPSGRDNKCTRCPDGFTEYEYIERDTSLHEF